MIQFNSIPFTPIKRCNYKIDYVQLFKSIEHAKSNDFRIETLRKIIKNDIFFLVYFLLGAKNANHPFIVQCCRDYEEINKNHRFALYIWPRYHFKTTIITIAGTIQKVLIDTERTHCILSYTKESAESMLESIKNAFETPFLIDLFPDILHSDPNQYNTWSLKRGLEVKRKNITRKEKNISTSALKTGLRTGTHFDELIQDDIETKDLAESPTQMERCKRMFESSWDLTTGSESDKITVAGTYHSNYGVLRKIETYKNSLKENIFYISLKSGSHDGTRNGKPVFLSKNRWDILKEKHDFDSQQLCDPTPKFSRKFNEEKLIKISYNDIPKGLYVFMVIDSAGDHNSRSKKTIDSDNWSIGIYGVEPTIDKLGLSNVYILDLFIDKIGEDTVVHKIYNMFFNSGIPLLIAYERLGNVTPAWLSNAMNMISEGGLDISEEDGTLMRLSHGNREKKKRLEDAIIFPLNNGKIHYSSSIPDRFIKRLFEEMEKHPFFKDDGLDNLAYLYDVLTNYDFKNKINTIIDDSEEDEEDDYAYEKFSETYWMGI